MAEQEKKTNETEAKVSPAKVSDKEAESHKAMAIIGYVFPFLFFVPFLTEAGKNHFAKFHANQQLILLVASLAVAILGTCIPFLGWFVIFPFGSIFLIVLAIIGIVNAAKIEKKALPLIGKIEFIK